MRKVEFRRRLKGLAFEIDRTMQDLMQEAYDDLFAKYAKAGLGQPPRSMTWPINSTRI
jgi:hypothetical protein